MYLQAVCMVDKSHLVSSSLGFHFNNLGQTWFLHPPAFLPRVLNFVCAKSTLKYKTFPGRSSHREQKFVQVTGCWNCLLHYLPSWIWCSASTSSCSSPQMCGMLDAHINKVDCVILRVYEMPQQLAILALESIPAPGYSTCIRLWAIAGIWAIEVPGHPCIAFMLSTSSYLSRQGRSNFHFFTEPPQYKTCYLLFLSSCS